VGFLNLSKRGDLEKDISLRGCFWRIKIRQEYWESYSPQVFDVVNIRKKKSRSAMDFKIPLVI